MALQKYLFLSLFVSVSHSANYDCLGHNCHHDAACEISFKTTSLFNTPLSTTGHCNRHDNHHNLQTCESLIGQLHKNQVYDTICLCYNAECVQRFVTATTITTHPPKVTHATHPTTIPTTTPTTIPTNATTTAATTTAASSTTTVSTTADWCIDTDPKCSDPSYQQYLCPSTELAARSFNIEFCPKACNLCTEYLEFLRTRTTTPPTSTFGVHVCADSDDKCTDMFYQAVNCTSTDPDIHRFNVERCPVSCNLCEEYYVRYPTQAPPTTAPPCVDTTSKCTDPIYKNLICNTTNPDTQAYALKTCPVSCNLCPKEAAPPCEDTTTKCLDPVYKSLICDTSNPDTKAYAAATCPKSCNLCPTSNTPDVPKEAFGK